MVRTSTVTARSFMVLMPGKVTCEQVGLGENTGADRPQPIPGTPTQVLVPTRPLPPSPRLKPGLLDAAHSWYPLAYLVNASVPADWGTGLCLVWVGRLPHSLSGDQDCGLLGQGPHRSEQGGAGGGEGEPVGRSW